MEDKAVEENAVLCLRPCGAGSGLSLTTGQSHSLDILQPDPIHTDGPCAPLLIMGTVDEIFLHVTLNTPIRSPFLTAPYPAKVTDSLTA